MRLTEGNWAPETDAQGVIGRQVTPLGAVEEAANMPRDDASILAQGGSNPASTDPGVTDAGPTGGGRAVPDAGVFENQNTLGDNASLDDGTGRGEGGAGIDAQGNSDDAYAGGPATGRNDRLSPGPQVRMDNAQESGVPMGAMPAGGATTGVPTGDLAGSYGEEGR